MRAGPRTHNSRHRCMSCHRCFRSYGRQYRVAGYEDDFTRKALGRGSERCFGLISAAGVRAGALGDTWSAIEASGLRVARAKMLHLTQARPGAGEAARGRSLCIQAPFSYPAGGRPCGRLRHDGAVARSSGHGDCVRGARNERGAGAPSRPAPSRRLRRRPQLLGEDPAGVWGSVCSLLPGGHLGRALPAHDERLRQAFFGPAAGRIASATEVPAVMGGGCSCVLILPSTVAAGAQRRGG